MVTFGEWVSSWIERRSIRLAPSTLTGYRLTAHKYITSPLSEIELTKVTPEDLIMLFTGVIASGKTRACQILQIMINASLKDAVRQRVLEWNPMDCVDRIQHHKQHTKYLTPDEAARLIETSVGWHRLAWELALILGLRRGELLGVRYDDIDYRRQELHIRRQRIRIAGNVIETPPKTQSSIRTIPIPDILMQEIPRGNGYILGGERPISERQLGTALRKDLKTADLPCITIHGLRHSMACVAASAGISVKTLQGLMGHAQYTTTADIYAHVDGRAGLRAEQVISIELLRKAHDWKSCNG